MIEQALRRFCESRYRSLIVIAGTFVVGLVLVIPLVDAYIAGRDEKEGLLAELDSARQVAGELQRFENRVAEKIAQLKVLDERTINDDSLPALRGKLVDLAKETGCSIRRISPGNTMTRTWSPGEDPTVPSATTKPTVPSSNFKLEWRPISLSLSGSTANLQNMVQRIAASGMLMHTKSFEMYPSSANRLTQTLDLELWYFTLARKG